jgi:uncharacterized protein YbbC (DUF1343 family)
VTRLRFGADLLAGEPGLLAGFRRVALVTNDAARIAPRATATAPAAGAVGHMPDDTPQHSRAALLEAGVPLVRIFSPEHGLSAAAPDGAGVGDAADPLTGLPVTSLYGERFEPPAAALADVDAVLFDVPDVGARFYTYAWTLTHVVDACAECGIPVVVLDRPNPAGGGDAAVEGPLLEPAHYSFLGRLDIPVRHGLTLGELALLWRLERRPDADVRMIRCEGWERRGTWHRTGLDFVPTSPAITCADAALLYPGLALFEATNVSVGRGSHLSFRAAGAPWLDTGAVLRRLSAHSLPGVELAATRFKPHAGPHAGVECSAICINLREPDAVRPVAAGLVLLATIAALHEEQFEWCGYPTAANPTGAGHLERLLGSSTTCAALATRPGSVTDDEIAQWVAAPGWLERRRQVLLYAESA